jgi:DNA-binding response OmpR family regulator
MDTVLVVDSDPLQRNLIMRHLIDAGYDVLEAANSVEAVRIANLFKGGIQLIVVPYPLGIDIARQVAAIRTSVPVLLTSCDSNEQISLSSELPAVNFAFLQKPFPSVVLIDKVRHVLSAIR